jgi:hypothetical protein
MTGRRLLGILGVLVLTAALALPTLAVAGKCGPKCKNEIAGCKAVNACDTLTPKREKKKCKRDCKKNTRKACKEGTQDCTLSPSGAFVDPIR